MIEKIPFLHRKKMYNIIVREDITFAALHHILDELIDLGVFFGECETENANLYTVVYEGEKYTVGVDGVDVMVVCS